MSQPQTELDPASRNIRMVDAALYPEYVDRWAIIVGISRYQHASLNLRFADRDAEELSKLVQTPSGGGFAADHIVELVNERATTANITSALRGFLQKPAAEDIVLIYFACHGAPDPYRPGNVYLLTHDTDPDNISSTALPMREINSSIQDNLNAKRVVLIADTCHSAAIGDRSGRRSSVNSTAAVNIYLQKLSEAQGGIALLTSAEANEVSLEDVKWGGGHGVFTHYLLEGMRGAADYRPKNGTVTVGELFEYVRENVKRATSDRQHPSIGTTHYDRDLPMAVTGGISAQQHYQLGCQLYELGRLLDDRRRYESAIRQFREAMRLAGVAGESLAEAHLEIARARLACGEHRRVIEELQTLVASPPPLKSATHDEADKIASTAWPPETYLYLGVAHAGEGKYDEAQRSFGLFLKEHPEHEHALWVAEYLQSFANRNVGSTVNRDDQHALLIGVGKYAKLNARPLSGPENDLRLLKDVFHKRFNFSEANIITLQDEAATRRAILNQLERLRQTVRPNDTVVIFFSGHSLEGEAEPYLLVHDSFSVAKKPRGGIGAEELHALIDNIPANHKTLILDTHPNTRFLRVARKAASYALMLCAAPGQQAFEQWFDFDGEKLTAGLFTYHFTQQLTLLPADTVTYGEIIGKVHSHLHESVRKQTPIFIGNRRRRLFTGEDHLSFFDFSQRRNYAAFSAADLHNRYARMRTQVAAPFPQAHLSFGRAFFEVGSYPEAAAALETAIQQSRTGNSEADFALAKAKIKTAQYAEARTILEGFHPATSSAESGSTEVQAAITQIKQLESKQAHALLIGIDEYANKEVPIVRGAQNDVELLAKTLHTRFKVPKKNITILTNAEATRERILDSFRQLARRAQDEFALFYFAGNGSTTADGAPTILSHDAREASVFDIELRSLASLTGIPLYDTNLVTIIDAGWTPHADPQGTRAVETDSRLPPVPQLLGGAASSTVDNEKRYLDFALLRLGQLALYGGSIKVATSSDKVFVEREIEITRGAAKKIHGELTFALIQSFREANAGDLTYAQLCEAIANRLTKHAPLVVGEQLNEQLWSNTRLQDRVLTLLRKIEHEPVNETIRILQRLIAQRNEPYPEGLLNLGIAYALKGEYEGSIETLEQAVEQGYSFNLAEAGHIGSSPEAHYHLGRVLYLSSKDLARAVSELRTATQQDSTNIHAFYYLGQAIRRLVERETLVEAEGALKTYLGKGAPLGFEDDVQRFLDERRVNEKQKPLTFNQWQASASM